MATADCVVHLSINQSSLVAIRSLIDEIGSAIAASPLSASAQQFFERLFDGSDLPPELVRVEVDPAPAGALDVTVSVYPTDFFRMLPTAIRAGNIDRMLAEQGHVESPLAGWLHS